MIDVQTLAKEAGILDWGSVLEVFEFGPPTIRRMRAANTDYLSRFAALVLERAAQECTTLDMESFGVIPIRAVIISNACVDAIRALKPKEPR
mgnify:CR=1 FL=1